ncbi:MAG TPA: enoyl-CoA hydratase/isomerase family protein [Acidimicrobiales bacterium]|jgi:enoyl-CoA hydratase|nr:enoyl-CoA hydratase/isomerase family protein [Acidimicrobiales bacterium]
MGLIELERPADGVALLTLDRPDRRNALSTELREEGCRLLAELAADESVRALVVTGAGTVFSAGFDLREFEVAAGDQAFGRRLWASSDEWHRRWIEFPVPTVAAVNGAAVAGGFDVAVMCDLRVVAASATFAHPEIAFGDVVYGPLHDLVGGAVARDLCLTGRRVDAAEADRLGLVTRLVPDGQARDAAVELAAAIAGAPRSVLVRTKAKAVRRAASAPGGTLDL